MTDIILGGVGATDDDLNAQVDDMRKRLSNELRNAPLVKTTTISPIQAGACAAAAASINQQTDATFLKIDATTGPVAIQLPDARLFPNQTYYFKRMDASSNTATVLPFGTQTIEGASSQALNIVNQAFALVSDGINWLISSSAASGGSLGVTFDADGALLESGATGDLLIPFNCTISSATILADQSGNIAIDIWKAPYSTYPPTSGQSITAAATPQLAAAIKFQDTVLTGWTKALTIGDTLRFNIKTSPVPTVERAVLTLLVTKS